MNGHATPLLSMYLLAGEPVPLAPTLTTIRRDEGHRRTAAPGRTLPDERGVSSLWLAPQLAQLLFCMVEFLPQFPNFLLQPLDAR